MQCYQIRTSKTGGRDQLTDLNKDEGNKCNGPFNLPVQQKQHR